MKRHICDVCKLNEITGTNDTILEGTGDIYVYYIRDEFPDTPVHRRLKITTHETVGGNQTTNEDICESCLKNMLLEALKN